MLNVPHSPRQSDRYDAVLSEVESVFDVGYLDDRGERAAVLETLYETAKRQQWNAATVVDWERVPAYDGPILEDQRIAIYGSPFWDRLSAAQRLQINRYWSAYTLCHFLDAEQAALLVCGQLVNLLPDLPQKLCVAVQLIDEARHVEVFRRYLEKRLGGKRYPTNPSLRDLLRDIRSDRRWYAKLIGMQMIIEGIGIASFRSMLAYGNDPLLKEIIAYVLRDEARHVAFGVRSLGDMTAELDAAGREEIASFAFEALRKASGRYFPREVYADLGFTAAEIEDISALSREGPFRKQFLRNLFSAVVQNLDRVGLITPAVRACYAAAGLGDFLEPVEPAPRA